MCFHSNQHPWATKHPFISLYSKYQSLKYNCLPVVNYPIFPSLDNIYCIFIIFPPVQKEETHFSYSTMIYYNLEI